MTPYNGPERRNGGGEDHDVLTRIDVNLQNFMKQFEEHIQDDKRIFKEINSKIDKHERIAYMFLGAVFLIEFFLRVIKWQRKNYRYTKLLNY